MSKELKDVGSNSVVGNLKSKKKSIAYIITFVVGIISGFTCSILPPMYIFYENMETNTKFTEILALISLLSAFTQSVVYVIAYCKEKFEQVPSKKNTEFIFGFIAMIGALLCWVYVVYQSLYSWLFCLSTLYSIGTTFRMIFWAKDDKPYWDPQALTFEQKQCKTALLTESAVTLNVEEMPAHFTETRLFRYFDYSIYAIVSPTLKSAEAAYYLLKHGQTPIWGLLSVFGITIQIITFYVAYSLDYRYDTKERNSIETGVYVAGFVSLAFGLLGPLILINQSPFYSFVSIMSAFSMLFFYLGHTINAITISPFWIKK
ncbi:hypothetical protein HDV06_000031 [Boothiomyces sp. JEL0866]|nr:hypothetical protein HDV06_000031 [Boothiomyces sp. JEL0866]